MINEVEKLIKYNSLLNIYGELLSLTQKEILTDYFEFNLSISEIAESRNVSRAAVEDAIKKGQKKLDEFELKLHILEKNKEISSLLNELKNEKDSLKREEIISKIERIVE